MFDTVFGLPVHVLVLHAAVIGVPVAALATAAVAVRPGWLPRFGWWVVGLDAVALAVVYVTRESGKKLVHRLFPDPSTRSADLKTHVERGQDMLWYAIGLFVVAVVLVLVARASTRGGDGGLGAASGSGGGSRAVPPFALPAVAVLAVAAAILAIVQVVRVGHSGSSAVWEDVVKSTDSASATR